MTPSEITELLRLHSLWLKDSHEGVRANLGGANLVRANLGGANLDGANLGGASLYRANLDGANLNWQSHDLLAEVLRRAAGDNVDRRMVAGLLLVSRDWCWSRFLEADHPEREWAMGILSGLAKGNEDAPKILLDYARAKERQDRKHD